MRVQNYWLASRTSSIEDCAIVTLSVVQTMAQKMGIHMEIMFSC